MTRGIAWLIADIRDTNIEKGHRPAGGGPGDNTRGDYIALMHSEVGEATDAYRSWRLADATGGPDGPREGSKPEGVGSELADVCIRLLDTCDVFGLISPVDRYLTLLDVENLTDRMLADLPDLVSFGDHMALLHRCIDQLWTADWSAPYMLRALVTTCRTFEIDLSFEVERKMRYNRTRPFQHGGRTLSDHHA